MKNILTCLLSIFIISSMGFAIYQQYKINEQLKELTRINAFIEQLKQPIEMPYEVKPNKHKDIGMPFEM